MITAFIQKYWIKALAVVGVLCIMFAVVMLGKYLIDKLTDAAIEQGASQQRESDLEATIQQTEQGNAARDEIRYDIGNARYDECLRTARTLANCERFLLEQ